MNEESLKLIIAFFAGLIPFILKIIFDNFSYKKSQLDKFGVILFEKQLELYQELNRLLADYQNNIASVIIAGSYGKSVSKSMINWYKELKEDSSFNLYQEQKKAIEKFIDGNTILIPDLLLTILHDYIEYSELLYNTWLKGVFDNLPEEEFNSDLKLITSREELIEFNNNLMKKHYELTGIIKMIVGTETLKRQIFQYTYSKKNIPKNIQRIRKAKP